MSRSLFRSSLFVLGQDTIATLLGLAGSVLLSRWLGPTQLGLFYILNLIPAYSEKFGRFGMVDNAAIYYMGRGAYPKPLIVGTMLWVSAALALVPVIVVSAFYPLFVTRFLHGASVPLIASAKSIAAAPFVLLSVSIGKYFLGVHDVGRYNRLQLLRPVTFLCLIVLFWTWHWGFEGACVALFAGAALSTLVGWAGVARSTSLEFRWDSALLRALFNYGSKIYLTSIVTFLQLRFDMLVVAAGRAAQEVTYYSLAGSLSLILLKLPNAVLGFLMARVAAQSGEEAIITTGRIVRLSSSVLVVAAIVVSAVAVPGVHLLYGHRYEPLLAPLWILMPGTVCMGLARLLTEHIYGRGKPADVFRATAWTTLVNVALNLSLTPRFGIRCAAAISSLTYLLFLIDLTRIVCRDSKRPASALFILRAEDIHLVRLRIRAALQRGQA